jgi:small GTP-binding protein
MSSRPIVAILGEANIGKTCLCQRLLSGEYNDSTESTVGGSAFQLQIGQYSVEFRDTAGQERYRSIAGIYYRDVSVGIFAYDITRLATLDAIRTFFASYKEIAPATSLIILVGLKKDLANEGQREVTVRRAEEFAATLESPTQDILEVSSKEGDGIEELKNAIEKALAKVKLEQGPEKVKIGGKGKKGRKRCCRK